MVQQLHKFMQKKLIVSGSTAQRQKKIYLPIVQHFDLCELPTGSPSRRLTSGSLKWVWNWLFFMGKWPCSQIFESRVFAKWPNCTQIVLMWIKVTPFVGRRQRWHEIWDKCKRKRVNNDSPDGIGHKRISITFYKHV